MKKILIILFISIIVIVSGLLFLNNHIFNNIESVELNETEVIKIGSIVNHPKFGSGEVLAINQGETELATSLQVEFSEHGTKWLMLEFANLELEK